MERSNTIGPAGIVRWKERLEDHNRKIEEYLQNCLFRGCNLETTVRSSKAVLSRLFNRLQIDDLNHPLGRRQILFWEFLDPQLGSSRLGLLIAILLEDDLAHGTRRKYMTELRCFFDYVLAKPNIPGTSEDTFGKKYGPIALSFTKYDLPKHAQDRPSKPRYAISIGLRDDLYEFLRTDYIPNHKLPHLGAQDYTAIVLQAEIGARVSELLGIRSGGESCDLNWVTGRVRLFGKAKAFSGKRIRSVPLTAFSTEVLRVFEKIFKPMFPRSVATEYLFLNESGHRLTDKQFFRNFRNIIELARNSGVLVPEDLRPHDLRRTCATNQLKENPLEYRTVLRKLGHTYPSSAAPYIIATDADVEDEQGDLLDIFIDPYIEEWGKN
jgi:integrase